jgi:hypothetical protein
MVARMNTHIYRILLGYGGLLHWSGVIHHWASYVKVGLSGISGSMARHLIIRVYIFFWLYSGHLIINQN